MRVSSEGTQKRILISGEALQEGETPDNLALYLPDGTPLNLAVSLDPTRMRWLGVWDEAADYVQNDVVNDEGDLFILVAEERLAGATAPSVEHDPEVGDTTTHPGGDILTTTNAGNPAYRVIDGERTRPATPVMYFFDLSTGGTVTITDTDVPQDYLQLYDSAGDKLGGNFPSPGFGSALVQTGLPSGRYFLSVEDSAGTGASHVHVVPSAGAVLGVPETFWEVMVRGA